MKTHGGQGVETPPVLRSAAPDGVEHILAGVPALRRAGLDELADSIEAMAHKVVLGVQPVPSDIERDPVEAGFHPVRKRRRQPWAAWEAAPTLGRANAVLLATFARARIVLGRVRQSPIRRYLGNAIVVLLASSRHTRTLSGRAWRAVRRSPIKRYLGSVLVVVVVTVDHARTILEPVPRAVRHVLIRRRELIWGAAMVCTASLVVGWVVVTRLH